MINYFEPLEPGAFYHIYNRGNNGGNIFFCDENYYYFLRKFDRYMTDYLDVYSYSLLPNHFHWFIKTKQPDEIAKDRLLLKKGSQILSDFSEIISEQFRRLFLSYAKAIKVQEGRTGSLFEKNFKRILIGDDQYLGWLINYIHRNPETHGITRNYRTYPYSSYQTMLSKSPTKVKRHEVLKLFGGEEEFIRYHQTNPVRKDIDPLAVE